MTEELRLFQDTVTLQLRDELVVTNDTVRVSVQVVALIADDTAEETIREDIRKALSAFIPDAEWHFNSIHRAKDGTGYERITLLAHTRVNERENYKLEIRAQSASRQGLQIGQPVVDTSVPNAKLEEAESNLRSSLVAKAVQEMSSISEAANRSYRLHKIKFLNANDLTRSAVTMSYGSGFSEAEGLANAQKLTMTAEVIFAAKPDRW